MIYHLFYVKETDGETLILSGDLQKIKDFVEKEKLTPYDCAIVEGGTIMKSFHNKRWMWEKKL